MGPTIAKYPHLFKAIIVDMPPEFVNYMAADGVFLPSSCRFKRPSEEEWSDDEGCDSNDTGNDV